MVWKKPIWQLWDKESTESLQAQKTKAKRELQKMASTLRSTRHDMTRHEAMQFWRATVWRKKKDLGRSWQMDIKVSGFFCWPGGPVYRQGEKTQLNYFSSPHPPSSRFIQFPFLRPVFIFLSQEFRSSTDRKILMKYDVFNAVWTHEEKLLLAITMLPYAMSECSRWSYEPSLLAYFSLSLSLSSSPSPSLSLSLSLSVSLPVSLSLSLSSSLPSLLGVSVSDIQMMYTVPSAAELPWPPPPPHHPQAVWWNVSEVGSCEIFGQVALNPLVPRVQKIKIRKIALADFYWLNL